MVTTPHEHTVKRFDQELNTLLSQVMEMGGLVERQIAQAVEALYEEDLGTANEVVARDHRVNGYEVQIDEAIGRMIALRQPMARDLRTILALSKAVTDLERIGDEAERIARMTVHIYEASGGAPQTRLLRDAMAMAKLAGEMLRGSLDALARRDDEKALAVARGDSELDEQFRDAMRRLITFMMEDHRIIGHAIDMIFIVKALERIGDHAKNIAEYVIYLVKGKDIRHLDSSERHATLEQD
ncbi:MAG: phosphate signaling complex protein PhoU [Candidatus Competibacterales bacterium]|nr:phosphate signaling complex protein PhoU [Candidatus Competibacterales bacterium]